MRILGKWEGKSKSRSEKSLTVSIQMKSTVSVLLAGRELLPLEDKKSYQALLPPVRIN
jgi:hypothetical protein